MHRQAIISNTFLCQKNCFNNPLGSTSTFTATKSINNDKFYCNIAAFNDYNTQYICFGNDISDWTEALEIIQVNHDVWKGEQIMLKFLLGYYCHHISQISSTIIDYTIGFEPPFTNVDAFTIKKYFPYLAVKIDAAGTASDELKYACMKCKMNPNNPIISILNGSYFAMLKHDQSDSEHIKSNLYWLNNISDNNEIIYNNNNNSNFDHNSINIIGGSDFGAFIKFKNFENNYSVWKKLMTHHPNNNNVFAGQVNRTNKFFYRRGNHCNELLVYIDKNQEYQLISNDFKTKKKIINAINCESVSYMSSMDLIAAQLVLKFGEFVDEIEIDQPSQEYNTSSEDYYIAQWKPVQYIMQCIFNKTKYYNRIKDYQVLLNDPDCGIGDWGTCEHILHDVVTCVQCTAVYTCVQCIENAKNRYWNLLYFDKNEWYEHKLFDKRHLACQKYWQNQ